MELGRKEEDILVTGIIYIKLGRKQGETMELGRKEEDVFVTWKT